MAYLKKNYTIGSGQNWRQVSALHRQENAAASFMFTDPSVIAEQLERPEWHGRAACGRNGVLGDDPAERVRIMFPQRGEPLVVERALAACDVCTVHAECDAANGGVELAHAREAGVWAGTTGRMRRTAR